MYFLFNRLYRAPVRYITKPWSCVLLNKKNTNTYIKCFMYNKLLKPRQSFRITCITNSFWSWLTCFPLQNCKPIFLLCQAKFLSQLTTVIKKMNTEWRMTATLMLTFRSATPVVIHKKWKSWVLLGKIHLQAQV